ncbi:methionyl-tRNA formyltransferase [Halobacteriales archaeon QS_4_69_34]|nr:MAG: methionyl-tRNA formyltransferase [Halobacteriales archaeon QS_4_69_34]
MTDRIETACLLVGEATVPEPFARAVERMVRETPVEIALVVIASDEQPGGDSSSSGGGADDGDTSTSDVGGGIDLGTLLARVERWGPVRRIKGALTDPHEPVALDALDCLSGARTVRCTTEPADGPAVSIPDPAVEEIAAAADVAIHNGVGILAGEVLTAPRAGVLGFHHGDIRAYRGIGYGFWEFMHGEDESGVTLQRLSPELDAGEIIAFASVDIGDAHTYPEVRRRLGAASIPLLAAGIENLDDPDFEPERVPREELGPVYYSSDVTTAVKARYLLREATNRLRRAISRR